MHAPRVRARRRHMSCGHSYPRMPHVDFPALCVALRRHRMECTFDLQLSALVSETDVGSSLLVDSSRCTILQRNYWDSELFHVSTLGLCFMHLYIFLFYVLFYSRRLRAFRKYASNWCNLSVRFRYIVFVNPSGGLATKKTQRGKGEKGEARRMGGSSCCVITAACPTKLVRRSFHCIISGELGESWALSRGMK